MRRAFARGTPEADERGWPVAAPPHGGKLAASAPRRKAGTTARRNTASTIVLFGCRESRVARPPACSNHWRIEHVAIVLKPAGVGSPCSTLRTPHYPHHRDMVDASRLSIPRAHAKTLHTSNQQHGTGLDRPSVVADRFRG